MRRYALFKTGFCLAITTLAIALPVRHVVGHHADQTALDATARNAGLISATLSSMLKTAIHESQSLVDLKSPDDAFGKTADLISVGLIEWRGENFSYVKRFDNLAFFRARKLDTKLVSDLLSLFSNDIGNVGQGLEQIYTGMLGTEAPVLVVISPLRAQNEEAAPQSSVAVLDAAKLLGVVSKSPKQFQAFAVDRFGTIILHSEHERAVHRESVASNPLVKSLLSSAQAEQTNTFAQNTGQFYGSATRLDVGGLTVVVQTPVAEARGFVREVWIVIALSGMLSTITILTLMYLSARVRRRKDSGEDEDGQIELKLAG